MTDQNPDTRADSPTFKKFLRVATMVNEHEHRQDRACSFFMKALDGKTYILCIDENAQFLILDPENGNALVPQAPTFWVPPNVDIQDWVGNGSTQSLNAGVGIRRNFRQNSIDEIRTNTNIEFGPLPYDGSAIVVRILWQLEGGGSGTGIKFNLKFGFIEINTDDAKTKVSGTVFKEIDVTTLSTNMLFETDMPPISGATPSALLELTLQRLGNDPFDDWNREVSVFATVMFREDSIPAP